MKITQAEFIKGITGTNSINDDGVPHIAFLGRSNVGKSSTINMLVNRKSLVKSSGTPGKTKEINFFSVNKKYYFVDLPGYGYAKVSKKAREKLRRLIMWYLTDVRPEERILVLVLDAQVGITDYDQELLDLAIEQDESVVILLNKSDKLNQKNKKKIFDEVSARTNYPVIMTSASKKKGRDDFFKTVFDTDEEE